MQKLQGFVEAGNTTLAITGAAGTIARKVQGSYPSATITVYAAGTVTLSTIYSDNGITPKANPFTAAADGTFFFYAANGDYDVKFSGGGITAPFTLGDFSLLDLNDPLDNVTGQLEIPNGIVLGEPPTGNLAAYATARMFAADDSETDIYIMTAGAAGEHSYLVFQQSLGTVASPTEVASNTILGEVLWQAYAGAPTNEMLATATIRARVDGAFTAGARPPSRIDFIITPTGGPVPPLAGEQQLAWTINSSRHLYPSNTTNTTDIGTSAFRVRNQYIGTSLSIGTGNLPDGGGLRFDNANFITFRNAANTANIIALDVDSSNNLRIGTTGGAGYAAATSVIVNDSQSDIDFILRADSTSSSYVHDAGAFSGIGGHAFGRAFQTNQYFTVKPPALSATDATSYTHGLFGATGAVTTTGSTPRVATLTVDEPNITIGGGSVADAYSLYVSGAPTEATRNGAAWFASGDVVVGTSAIATNATIGFLHIPSCAGVPTGVPANGQAGTTPLVFDRTNGKLYAYNSGWINVGP